MNVSLRIGGFGASHQVRTSPTSLLPIFLSLGFGLLGLVLIGFSVRSALQAKQLQQHGIKASGTVAALKEERRKDKHGKVYLSFRSVVRFVTVDGGTVELELGGERKVGSVVNLIYFPNNPYQAKENSGSALWGESIGLGVAGLLFGLIGFGSAALAIKRRNEILWLIQSGVRIPGRVIGVERKTTIRQRDRSDHYSTNRRQRKRKTVLIVEATNPLTGQLDHFRSDSMTGFTSDNIVGTSIDVLIDPQDPMCYFVDVR